MVEPDLQNDRQAAYHATMIDEYLDHKWKGSGRHRFHVTRFWHRSRETRDLVETQSAEMRSALTFFATAHSFRGGHWVKQRESDSDLEAKDGGCR